MYGEDTGSPTTVTMQTPSVPVSRGVDKLWFIPPMSYASTNNQNEEPRSLSVSMDKCYKILTKLEKSHCRRI